MSLDLENKAPVGNREEQFSEEKSKEEWLAATVSELVETMRTPLARLQHILENDATVDVLRDNPEVKNRIIELLEGGFKINDAQMDRIIERVRSAGQDK